MAKFNLKEHIAKNKATFFGSLTEGQFSWMTQDTGQQIGSQDENKIPVYMFDDKGKYYYENDYDGYGVFGGMDYYELLDKMNGGEGDRSRGIDLAFGKEKTSSEVLFPALVTKPDMFNYKSHDFTKEPESDPNQSWYAPEEDDFYDQNDEEVFGDMDKEKDYDYSDEEELDEASTYDDFARGDDIMGIVRPKQNTNTSYSLSALKSKLGKETAEKIIAALEKEGKEYMEKFSKLDTNEEIHSFLTNFLNPNFDKKKLLDEAKKEYYKDAEADDAEHIKALEKDMKDDKKSSLKEGTASSFSEWLEGIKNINPKVANDFQKYPKLANAKSKEEFIKIAKEVGELYGEDEDQIIYDVGNTIYIKEFPSTGYKSISVSSGLESYGRYVDETENMVSNETPEQARNRVYPPGSRMDENKPTTKMKKSELKEYEVIYYYEGSKCMSRNDEGEVMEVSMDKCRRFAQNENKETNKMKKSELKEKIKEMVLAEMNIDVDNTTKEYDFLAELEGMLNEVYPFAKNKPGRIAEFITALNRLVDEYHAELYLNNDLFAAIAMVIQAAKEEATNLVNEAEDDTEKDTSETDTTTDTTTDTETTDVTTTAEVDPNVKAVQDSLTQAQAAAQQLGDAKLLDQIGNTITFFTRTHVVDKPGTVAESMFPLLKKILK
jgi:hypothetical protein